MGLYRDESGLVFEIDDAFAEARAYTPVSPEEEADIYRERGLQARAEERGIAGSAAAFGSRLASGATLGLSDVFLGEVLDPSEREQLLADIEAHPYLSAAGELAGAIGTGIAAPGSFLAKTPTGYLGQAAFRQVESGLTRGGIAGTARAVGAMGAEGAVQSVGQYIGHAALENKDLTAEGLSGAAGLGFGFGAVGGGAALGVVKGTMAARKMFARTMDGSRVKDAETAWSRVSQEALDADAATAQAAQAKVDEILASKREALRYKNETAAIARDEQIRASGETAKAAPSGETRVAQTSSAVPEGPEPLIDVGPQPAGDLTTVHKSAATDREYMRRVAEAVPQPKGAKTDVFKREGTKVIPRPVETPSAAPAAGEMTDLERQLAVMKDQIDAGRGLNPPYLPTGRAPFSNLRAQLGKQLLQPDTLAELRKTRTTDLLGGEIAGQEARLVNALDEYNAARKDFERVVQDDFAPQTVAGNRKALEVLDRAHEESLLRAQRAVDPREAGGALKDADDLERLLEGLAAPRVTKADALSRKDLAAMEPDDVSSWIAERVPAFERYEKATAVLAETVGDAAHPATVARSKAALDAEREGLRKVTDRAARAVDDAEQFGPAQMSPKERVRYARERASEAQRSLDEINVQEGEARDALKGAQKKAREGEKAKRAALRTDARATSGASEALGAWEILDLPGMPKVSDLPIVGPLLGAWLKFRTLKAALGRKMSRTAATPDARAAALASRTRDRVARAVDRSLGALERGGKYAYRYTPRAAGILSSRIYDDGEPDAKKGAPITEQAATRVRELASYVATPGAIERDVRKQLIGVTDPDLIAAAEKHRRATMEWLLANAPKAPEQGMMKTVKWAPSPAQSMSFARRLEAVDDPAGVYERLAEQQAMISLEAAEALRAVYPQMLAEAQQRALERIVQMQTPPPYRTRVQLSLLYRLPLDSALEPDNLKITQSVYERKPSSPAYLPAAAPPPQSVPQPAIAQPVDISQAYMPKMDRR